MGFLSRLFGNAYQLSEEEIECRAITECISMLENLVSLGQEKLSERPTEERPRAKGFIQAAQERIPLLLQEMHAVELRMTPLQRDRDLRRQAIPMTVDRAEAERSQVLPVFQRKWEVVEETVREHAEQLADATQGQG